MLELRRGARGHQSISRMSWLQRMRDMKPYPMPQVGELESAFRSLDSLPGALTTPSTIHHVLLLELCFILSFAMQAQGKKRDCL